MSNRMSRKDVYRFLNPNFDDFITPGIQLLQNQQLQLSQQKTIMVRMKQSIEVKRLDNSHYGIEVLNQFDKSLLRNVFEKEKQSILNNSKEEEASGQSDTQQSYDDWRKLPRGWFSTKNYEWSDLCIRHATSKEYVSQKWTISLSPFEEDLIFIVNLFAKTLESEAHLEQFKGTPIVHYESRKAIMMEKRKVSQEIRSQTRSNERSRSRDVFKRRQQMIRNESELKNNKNSFSRVLYRKFFVSKQMNSFQLRKKKSLIINSYPIQ